MEEFALSAVTLRNGKIVTRKLRVHDRRICEGRDVPCVIHSPSDHHMRDWELHWRDDTGVMERICPHGVGHPDPDHMAYMISRDVSTVHGVHGCDGCCEKKRVK